MKGIDISAWQTNIDWDAVKAAGIEFVIVKLGEGGSLDSKFIDHINNAVANGMKVGVYVYSHATTAGWAEEEANWVDLQIQQYLDGKEPEMGIWYDMEDSSIEESGADITALCSAFIDMMHESGYSNIGVYSSYNWLTNGNINTGQLDVPYWCAQYNYECNFEHPNLKIWQYSDSLIIDGQLFDADEYY